MATQQICIFAYVASFQDWVFLHHKRCGLFLNSYKMAKQRDQDYYNELLNGRGMGRAQQFWNAIQDARRRKVRDFSPHIVPLSRAGNNTQGLRRHKPMSGQSQRERFPINFTATSRRKGRGRALPPSCPNPSKISLLHTLGDSRIMSL